MTPTTDPLRDWFDDHGWCVDAREWYDFLPAADCTAERVWALCDRGDWLLWWHVIAGTPREMLAPVVYRAADRACREYAPAALQAAGLTEQAQSLRSLAPVVDRATARTAWDAARDVWAAMDAAREFAGAVAWAVWAAMDAARAAGAAAGDAEPAAWVAAEAAGDAGDAELRRCAEDCRELLGPPGQLGDHR